jgi:hypothetical protein
VVQIQLSNQNITLPSGPWVSATTAAGAYAGVLTPVAAGTWYVWVYDPTTGLSAVSSAVSVPSAALPLVPSVPVGTSQAASLLGGSAAGVTPDLLSAAGAATDGDTAMVAQSSKVLFAQPFSAIWTWITTHLLGYLLPVVQVTAAGTVLLNNAVHNQRILQITASGVTISPNTTSLGAGFVCDVINDSGSTVALSGMTVSTGASVIAAGSGARILGRSVSGTVTLFVKL